MRKKNVRKRAVALRYEAEKDPSPKVIGKGEGNVAENIIQKAMENNIPIQEDASLVEMLSELEVNESIPPELYEVVAEVFAFIYNVDRHYLPEEDRK